MDNVLVNICLESRDKDPLRYWVENLCEFCVLYLYFIDRAPRNILLGFQGAYSKLNIDLHNHYATLFISTDFLVYFYVAVDPKKSSKRFGIILMHYENC